MGHYPQALDVDIDMVLASSFFGIRMYDIQMLRQVNHDT